MGLFAFLDLFLPHSTKARAHVSFAELIFGWTRKPSNWSSRMGFSGNAKKAYDRGFIICLRSNKQANRGGKSILSPQC